MVVFRGPVYRPLCCLLLKSYIDVYQLAPNLVSRGDRSQPFPKTLEAVIYFVGLQGPAWPFFLWGDRVQAFGVSKYPRHWTHWEVIWAFLGETLYPLFSGKCNTRMEFLLVLEINKSSTYCRNVPLINWSFLNSLAKTFPNKWGLSLRTEGAQLCI